MPLRELATLLSAGVPLVQALASIAPMSDERRRDSLLQELHAWLERKRGDDDISFVWVSTTKPPEPESVDSTMAPDGGDDHAC